MIRTVTAQQGHPTDHRVRPNPEEHQSVRAEMLEDGVSSLKIPVGAPVNGVFVITANAIGILDSQERLDDNQESLVAVRKDGRTSRKDEFTVGPATHSEKSTAMKSKYEICPQDSSGNEGENDESTIGRKEIDPAFQRTFDFRPTENATCTCGRSFSTVRGMKIHRTKMRCATEHRPDVKPDNSEGDTDQVSNHSVACPLVSVRVDCPKRERVAFPPSRSKKVWSMFDEALYKRLRKVRRTDRSIKAFTDCAYEFSKEQFGCKERKENKVLPMRRQSLLAQLRGEKRTLSKRWKSASDDEKTRLTCRWKEISKRINDVRRAERQRVKKYERRRSRRSFFRDPFGFGRALLDPPKSGWLEVSQDTLEEHLVSTYGDDCSDEELPLRNDIPSCPPPGVPFNNVVPLIEEVREVVRKARNKSAPGPNGIPYVMYKRCPRTLIILFELIWVLIYRLYILYIK